MFIALGIITLGVAAACFMWLPDNPMNAKFLSDQEKVALIKHVSVNMTGIENHKTRPKELLEAVKDPQVWLLFLGLGMAAMSHGLTGTYSTTLIKNMGFSSKKAALLNMPMGIVGVVTNLGVGFGIRRTSNRWLWAVSITIRKSLTLALNIR
jgi:predicted MFS family arabinose efflux permease